MQEAGSMQEVQSAGGLGTHDPAAKGRHQETCKDRLPHKACSLTHACLPQPVLLLKWL